MSAMAAAGTETGDRGQWRRLLDTESWWNQLKVRVSPREGFFSSLSDVSTTRRWRRLHWRQHVLHIFFFTVDTKRASKTFQTHSLKSPSNKTTNNVCETCIWSTEGDSSWLKCFSSLHSQITRYYVKKKEVNSVSKRKSRARAYLLLF